MQNTHDAIPFLYEAERNILVDYNNIYYNYPSAPSGFPGFRYIDYSHWIESKEKPAYFNGATLRSNYAAIVNGAQPPVGGYAIAPGNMTICCLNFATGRMAPPQSAPEPATNSLTIFPNPANDRETVTINYRFMENIPAYIAVYDMKGKLMGSYMPQFADDTYSCYFPIDISKLTTGLYIVRVTNGKETMTGRITIMP